MSVEKNNIDIYGTHYKKVDTNDKFDIIKELYSFKKGCVKDSYEKNELYLVNDNLGVYKSWKKGYMVAQLTPYYNEQYLYDWDKEQYYTERFIECYRCDDFTEIAKYYDNHKEECDKWFIENIDKEVYEKKLEELKTKRKDESYNQYYEFEMDNQKNESCHIYLENKRFSKKDHFNLDCNQYGSVIKCNDLVLGNNDSFYDNEDVFETLLRYICINRHLFDDLRKLDEGYVFNNQYYEKIDYIYDDIKEIIADKKLLDKFMNQGLTLEDLKEGDNSCTK